LSAESRRQIAAAVMPAIRGLISRQSPKVGHFNDSEPVLQFVNSEAFGKLAALGTSCPDHFLRTKIRPLVLPFEPSRETQSDLLERLPAAVEAYRGEYKAYYDRCKRPNSPAMRDPNAVVHLIPSVGMITFAADKATARIASEFYINAINVMRESSGVSTYRGLPEQEAFDIEYWLLEEAKLQRRASRWWRTPSTPPPTASVTSLFMAICSMWSSATRAGSRCSHGAYDIAIWLNTYFMRFEGG